VITAALTVLVAPWRLALIALVAQYVILALLLATLVPPPLAIVRFVAGGLAAFILYISMRFRAAQDRMLSVEPTDVGIEGAPVALPRPVFAVGFPFRFFAIAFVVVSINGVAASMTFLGLPSHVLFGTLWLIAVGLLTTVLAREALRLGMGVLLFSAGFSVLEIAVEGSLFLYGLLCLLDLVIALGVAHLATLPRDVFRRRRGDQP
jgi:hypothetical protein